MFQMQFMNIKSSYFKMKKDEFEAYLKSLKSQTNSIHLLNDKYFYVPTIESTNGVLHLNKKIYEFDSLMNSFSKFAKKQIIQSFLLEEIQSTNKTENIQSTKHDIFSVISSQSTSNDKKIVSITNVYKQLLLSNGKKIMSCKDTRELYDEILAGSIVKDDLPDGLYFRKSAVFINDGIKNIHMGVNDEDKINLAMEEFLKLYNSKNETVTKLILAYFMLESIHPFYDGNGRLGRFLFSNELLLETNSCFAFLISSAFVHQKSKYYQALKKADDKYEFGCLNSYFETVLSILNKEIDSSIEKIIGIQRAN